jgi:Zn-dependent metalloprotease
MKHTLLLIFVLFLRTSSAFSQSAVQGAIENFATQTGAYSTIDKATNSISFLRFPVERAFKINGSSSEERALVFVKENSALFGQQTSKVSHLVQEVKKDKYGLEHVSLQQFYQGVPIFDGVLRFHFNNTASLTSMNGNYITVDKLNAIPTISKEAAAAMAVRIVESQKTEGLTVPLKAPLKVHKNTLYVFQKGLVQGYNGQKHLVYEVEVRNDADIREFVYIDAHTSELVEQFTGMHSIDRKLYETSVSPANLKWEEANGIPSAKFNALDVWQKSEVESAGFIYNLMKNAFGHVSYDNAGATMVTINNNPLVNCPNATWNGTTANYCTNVAADDIVAHEWAHAYTEYTSGLVYAWQPGALNEAYSDIWGETVDLLNGGYFDGGEGTALRASAGTNCPDVAITSRWKAGEQAIAFNGAIRDMYNPNCFGDPGRVTDPLYYCTTPTINSTNDQGGVHTNSGVINHSYALLVDGGIYNGQAITGIGLTKAAHIYWYAQANFMNKTTDFVSQADILLAAGQALLGINLPVLSTGAADLGLSGQSITDNDLAQLEKVILAVEMRAETKCGYEALLKPVDAICLGGTPQNAFFFYDFENGLNGWSVANQGGSNTWSPRNWVVRSDAPGSHPGKVVYAENYGGVDCATDLEHGVMFLTSPVMTIPAGAPAALSLAFDHYVSLEAGYDGGNIKYKIGGGNWTLIPQSAFTANGYNRTITTSGSSNPLRGEPGFTGSNGGAVSGSWGQSRINLTDLGLDPGETVQFRWDLGSDECVGLDGWYIDNVAIYSCALPTVQFATAVTTVSEDEAVTAGPAPNDCLPYVEKIIAVKINAAPSGPVTVTFNAPTGTATVGTTADYSFTPASVVLQAGSLSKNVTVRIYNDGYLEGPETAVLSYTISGANGELETTNQTHTIVINDNEIAPNTIATTLLSADFTSGAIPAGWVGGGSYPSQWAVVSFTSVGIELDRDDRRLLIANSNARLQSGGLHTFSIETASFSTLGSPSINLSFLEYFSVFAGGYPEVATVDVWDGTTWHNILTHTEAGGNIGGWGPGAAQQNISIPTAYASAATKLRFRYTANYDNFWAIDKIRVTGAVPTQIEDAVSAMPDNQYLGPNATAYFYDPSSHDLIAKIKNLTSFDYGCTAVSIDRAGANASAWVGTYKITNKTFKVTPTHVNPTGSYEITLYYKASELGTFKNQITSMGKSAGSIGAGNMASSSYAEVKVESAFNTDYAYTATFTSGFSGFGLSDAPPIGPLPVTLTNFEGRHTDEGNVLSWATAAELNNEYFAVEKTMTGKNFTEVGRVEGNGNSSIQQRYTFLDTNYPEGITYYRLKQVDKDGRFAYSHVIPIKALSSRNLKFFPNPVQSLLTMELPDQELKSVDVRMINVSGQEVLTRQKVGVVKGNFNLDVAKLPAGIYRIILSGEKTTYHLSVLKL